MADIDQDLVDAYKLLIIKQYWNKPKANAEIGVMASSWAKVVALLKSIQTEYDLDNARGAQQDVIGRIVGIPRTVPFVIPKIAFGFSENPNSRGFSSKFIVDESAPFSSKFSSSYTSQQLSDNDYIFFIRAKIAFNNASSYISSDDRLSIQDVIQTVFSGEAYVIDNYDMTLTLYVSTRFDLTRVNIIKQLGLLPKPQGVRYRDVETFIDDRAFGFSDNPNASPMSDRYQLSTLPGLFADRIV